MKKTLSEQTNVLDSLTMCEGELTKSEMCDALKNIPNKKSPGNDGLTKEFQLRF